jgi:hypothetical protein
MKRHGPNPCSNHSLLALYFLILVSTRGNAEVRRRCATWQGRCQVCAKSRGWLQGIFCANFSQNSSHSQACQSMWCGSYYTSLPEYDLYVKTLQPTEEEENQLTDSDRLQASWGNRAQRNTDFRQARDGDHLLFPFECDGCIYKKLRNGNRMVSEEEDKKLRACIRQINLDAFWSRASPTVKANRDKTKLALELSKSVGLEGPFVFTTCMPPFDHCGYEVAIQMLLPDKS